MARGLVARVRRRGPGAGARPRLSVVVPVYDVERYLPACLDSVLAQPFGDLEVVVVDDGSPDRSGEIAEERASRDDRVRVVHQENRGLGGARNAGVEASTGELLAFLDSDDVLPADAYSKAVATLDRTGSDLVVGALERQVGDRRTRLPLMRRNHAEDRLATTVEESPLMLADVFAVNKVFRRSFWESAGLAFPVGVRYEDQPALTRALLAARRFDVLADTTYLWQVRGDGTSITQRRHEIDDLRDRLLTKRWSTEMVVSRGSPRVADAWFRTVLPVDMWEYFRSVPGCSPDYWALLRAGLLELWNDETLPFDATDVPERQRAMARFVAADDRAGLERFLAWLDAGA